MARETKSLGQKDKLDRFYTKPHVAKRCIDRIKRFFDLKDFEIIEPCAGNGSFSKQLNCEAFDIEPADPTIQNANWFELDKTQFNRENIMVIGNPPFGQQGKMALKFFEESAKFADVIAFIMPKSFMKPTIQNRMNLNFGLVTQMILDPNSFLFFDEDYEIPTVFQVWKKLDTPRKKEKLKTKTELFDFADKEHADFRIQRVGGNAGKASFDIDYSSNSNYFICNNRTVMSDKDLVDLINETEFPSIEWTVGPKSLSKGELIQVLEDKILTI